MAGCAGARAASAPHTLIVPPSQADTIFVPSLLKPTERMGRLWAFVFSATKARDEASAKGQGVVRCEIMGDG